MCYIRKIEARPYKCWFVAFTCDKCKDLKGKGFKVTNNFERPTKYICWECADTTEQAENITRDLLYGPRPNPPKRR
jgi:hypothetical protein